MARMFERKDTRKFDLKPRYWDPEKKNGKNGKSESKPNWASGKTTKMLISRT